MIRKWGMLPWLIAALTILSAVIFQSGLDNPFIFDDVYKIRGNSDLHLSEFQWQNYLHDYSDKKTNFRNDPSRPLTFFTYWILWQSGNGEAWPFHLASILLHSLCALLAGLIAARLTTLLNFSRPWLPAFLVSLFFLSHPVHAGTVIYAYGLSDVLSTFFSLLMLSLYLREKELRWWTLVLIPVFYMAAVFSKQSALIMPAVILAADFLLHGTRSIQRRWLPHVFLFSLAGLYLFWRIYFFGRLGDLEAENTFQVGIYAPLQGLMIWKYVAAMLWPSSLSIDHSFTPTQFEYWQCTLAWLALIALTILSLRWARNSPHGKLLAFSWLFFLLTLLPTSSLFPTTDLYVERRVYLPSVGLLLGSLMGLSEALKGRRVWALSLALLAFTVLSIQRVEVYGNEEKLWQESMQLHPRNERARVNLITHYLRVEKFQEAESEIKALLEMYPNFFEGLINLGVLYQHPKNPNRNPLLALTAYQQVLQQEPLNITTLMNLGILFIELKRYSEAVDSLLRLLALNPNQIQARLTLGSAYMELGLKDRAQEQARFVLQREPGNLTALKLMHQSTSF